MTKISAEEIVRGYGNGSLQQMARARELDWQGKGKDALVEMVVPTLFDPERVRRAVESLEPAELALLDQLVLAGGDAATDMLRRTLERRRLVDPRVKSKWGGYEDEKGSPWSRGSSKFADLVARLGVLGLAFTSGGRYGSGLAELSVPGRRLFIPDPILDLLPPVVVPVETTAPPATVADADTATLHRDFYTFFSIAAQSPVPLTARGMIAKRALVQIDEAMLAREQASAAHSEDDLARLPLIRALSEDLGLLVERGGELIATDRVGPFLDEPHAERQRRLFAAYRDTRRWGELFHISGILLKGPRVVTDRLAAARQRVLAEVAEMPAGEWVPFDHLVERMKERAYEFLFPRWLTSTYTYYSYDDRDPNPYARGGNEAGWSFDGIWNEAAGWDQVERSLIGLMVRGPLHWLGLLDLGLENRRVVSFRVTAAGAALLRGERPAEEPAEPHVVVQPNFQVLAFPPTSEGVLFRLDGIADRVRSDKVVEYRLSRESVYRAQRAGRDAASVLAFLEEVARAPLPQNVRRTLEEWGAQHDRIVARRGAGLLQTIDEAALDAICANLSLGSLLGRRISPTAALVPRANLPALYERLLGSGMVPALSEGRDDAGCLAFKLDGPDRIVFDARVPSIYVQSRFRPFAVEEPDGSMRLTRDSLRNAAGRGISAEEIIGVLEASCIEVPAETAAMVRRWTKQWGSGYLGEVALLRVESRDVLADLLADPEIGPEIEPIPGTGTLATVRRGSLRRVRQMLEQLGMALGGQDLSEDGRDYEERSAAPQ